MIVRLMWPACDYHHGRWSEPSQDAFWLECTIDELAKQILPLLSAGEVQRAEDLKSNGWNSATTFLVSRDLKSINPLPESYPHSGMWNANCPFIEIPVHQLKTLEEIKMLPLGPQYAGDSVFTRRMRLHQSWYRHKILKVPFGTGPKPGSTSSFGNMLTEDAVACGKNFLSPEIHALTLRRIEQCKCDKDGLIDEFRLKRNMMASQAMCFNLFGPPALDRQLATRLFQALLPGEVESVTEILFEYAPAPASNYLADKTAFDAFVHYQGSDGHQHFIGIETKLTEPFSEKEYPIDAPKHNYRKWTEQTDSPWPESSRTKLDAVVHNQLWRDHMLVQALRVEGDKDKDQEYASGKLMLVRHSEDLACAQVVDGYRQLLKPKDSSFIDMPLDKLISIWASAMTKQEHKSWLENFRGRYIDLHLSTMS